MALAEGEEIGQGGKVLSIVLILANTFGYMSCLWKYQVGNEKYVFRQENVNITQRPQQSKFAKKKPFHFPIFFNFLEAFLFYSMCVGV